MASTAVPSTVSLEDRYELESGRVFMTGLQAIVRVLLEQRRADVRAGLRTAVYASGYQGSPLGTLDLELARRKSIADAASIVHRPGVNEELAATAIYGTQLLDSIEGATVDGVIGVWYGKSPGVDRAADAIRHGNLVGTSPTGGVFFLAGDDPSCKSSTIPCASEGTLAALGVPTLYPGNVQEVLDFGLHAIACSRASGAWTALKIVTNVADGTATVDVDPGRVRPVIPTREWRGVPFVPRADGRLLPPFSGDLERSLVEVRLPLAEDYAALNGLNRVILRPERASTGIVAAGKSYYDLREALLQLGLDEAELEARGIALLKIGMIFPLEGEAVRRFADGLEQVIVIEEKRPLLETAVRDALYGTSYPPAVIGKKDREGAPLLSSAGELDGDQIAAALARVLPDIDPAALERRERVIAAARSRATLDVIRKPFYCSGCPHNRSTLAPEGQLVGAGIGCHSIAAMNAEGRGDIIGITQMGGEGMLWLGLAPFVERDHLIQNTGDGTFFHSGSLALRAAIASGVNITYKLLYNRAVAMTGGQGVEGDLSVPDVARLLEVEGVKQIVITTDEPERYRAIELPSIASVRPRTELEAVQLELAKVKGITVLIHDQQCAAEKRRLRKRKKIADPVTRVHVNERVCEGCGDCGRVSSCLSVEPVETEFGRKTRIEQASCNKDYSCLEGDCPSFLTVTPGTRAKPAEHTLPADLPLPTLPAADRWSIRMVGIGGTGVVTVNQIVGMAALIDGKHAAGLDQTGLSQKAGLVTSDVRIGAEPIGGANKLGAGGADLYLVFDLVGALAPANLAVTDPARTRAVVSTSLSPTGDAIRDVNASLPRLASSLDELERHTRADGNAYVDAVSLSMALFDDAMPANLLLVGAAWQAGLLPLSLESIEQAIRLNGAGVDANLAAFAWGRAAVARPEAVAAVLAPPEAPKPELDATTRALLDANEWPAEVRRLLEIRVPDLVGYQSEAYAADYIEAVRAVCAAEQERVPGHSEVTEAVARNLYKLLAYKDEYEVARLHLDAAEQARRDAAFGSDAKIAFHLHPPLLRSLGLKRKLKLGAWFLPVFKLLRSCRGLRGSWLDPFGRAKVRRVERALPVEYRALVDRTLAQLTPETHDRVAELLRQPDLIRGYEEIKLANVERYRAKVAELEAKLLEREPAAVSA